MGVNENVFSFISLIFFLKNENVCSLILSQHGQDTTLCPRRGFSQRQGLNYTDYSTKAALRFLNQIIPSQIPLVLKMFSISSDDPVAILSPETSREK